MDALINSEVIRGRELHNSDSLLEEVTLLGFLNKSGCHEIEGLPSEAVSPSKHLRRARSCARGGF